MDKDYIFNVPIVHVAKLCESVYPSASERSSLMVQEIGEFLQAYSKYQLVRDFHAKSFPMTFATLDESRTHLVEEMTHVLVCLGMLAVEEGITQDEIDDAIRRKAIAGVNYPFDVSAHDSLENVISSLRICATERTGDDARNGQTCFECPDGDTRDCTITCRKLLKDALYYLEESNSKADAK